MGSGVAGALRRGANGPLNDEAMSKGPIELGAVAVTDAYDLDADYVIHAAAIFDSERIPPSSACGRLLEGLRPSLFTGA